MRVDVKPALGRCGAAGWGCVHRILACSLRPSVPAPSARSRRWRARPAGVASPHPGFPAQTRRFGDLHVEEAGKGQFASSSGFCCCGSFRSPLSVSVRGFLKSYLLEYRRILAFQLDFLELLREVGANGASPAVWWLFTVQWDRIKTTNVLAQGSSPLPLPWLVQAHGLVWTSSSRNECRGILRTSVMWKDV